ncbi:MAG: GNAT family N-acetyltransferase [Thermoplasmata archaeon]
MSEDIQKTSLTVSITRLPADRWEDYRKIRLEGLKVEPIAFSSSAEDEEKAPESLWKERIINHIFAQKGSDIVGVIGLLFRVRGKQKHIADIFGLFVKERFRGIGIGDLLLKEAIKAASSREGIKKIELGVIEDQRPAIALYEKNGFQRVGTFSCELLVNGKCHNEILMEKLL